MLIISLKWFMTHFILFLYLNSFNFCSPNYFNSALLLCLSSIRILSDWEKDKELSHYSLSYLICLLSSELIPSLCSRGRQLSCSFSQKQDSTSNCLQCEVCVSNFNWQRPSSSVSYGSWGVVYRTRREACRRLVWPFKFWEDPVLTHLGIKETDDEREYTSTRMDSDEEMERKK